MSVGLGEILHSPSKIKGKAKQNKATNLYFALLSNTYVG